MKKFIKKPVVIVSIIVIAVIIATYFYFSGSKKPDYEFVIAKRAEIIQEVSVTGRVKPAEDVNLAFEKSGKVSAVYADIGKQVSAGQTLVVLENSELAAQLRQAEAEVDLKRADRENVEVNLDRVREQQDILVENAYRTLLSKGLTSTPRSSSYTATPPIITGRYDGPEGTYKISISHQLNSDTYELRTFGVERTGPTEILEDEPTPLGSYGLFIDFPDDLAEYKDTIWYITIPNTASSVYLDNYNAYQEALRERDLEIAAAEADLASQAGEKSVAEAELESAIAEVERLQSEIAKCILRAPISGTVTKQDAKVGEIISANTPVISVISSAKLEIEANVAEADIAKLKVNDSAKVTLDAYGEDVIFEAKAVEIEPAETMIEGVATYKTTLQFNKEDERIKSGMTANIDILTAKVENALVVPQRAVIGKNNEKFVKVLGPSEEINEIKVKTGLRGSDGNIEILEGIKEGDKIVVSTK